jgi:hypothetical protein
MGSRAVRSSCSGDLYSILAFGAPMADDKDRGFKISDHRKFNPDGTPREQSAESDPVEAEPQLTDASAEPEPQQSAGKVLSFPGEASRKKDPSEGATQDVLSDQDAPPESTESASAGAVLPDPSFDELVNMLTVEAVMHLGLIENPMRGGVAVDLEAARHMIDMLGMLQQKTRGNLSPDESLLIDNVVADLRMQFIGVSRGR